MTLRLLPVSGAVTDLDSLLGELESLSVECREKLGMEAEEEEGGKDAGLEVQLDDLTEKLRHALDTGEEITTTLGKTPGFPCPLSGSSSFCTVLKCLLLLKVETADSATTKDCVVLVFSKYRTPLSL